MHLPSCSWLRICSTSPPATNIDTPGWGHAEAYLALGRELQARGDHLGARNWIEKSLIGGAGLQSRATPAVRYWRTWPTWYHSAR